MTDSLYTAGFCCHLVPVLSYKAIKVSVLFCMDVPFPLQPFEHKVRTSHYCDCLRKYAVMTTCEIISLTSSLQPLTLRCFEIYVESALDQNYLPPSSAPSSAPRKLPLFYFSQVARLRLKSPRLVA